MEKKTIGGFISALRKANGLTQKQLAEKLNVSDKAVSRWERDEAMPDLSLIPELAEIFGVTTDEILRGERRNPDTSAPPSKERSEKQRKRLLADKKTKYQIRTTISIGIAVLGLIAAMICNFGFLRAYLGFMIATVFFAASAVCQVIFIFLNLASLDDELVSEAELLAHREHTVKLATINFGTILTLLAATLPLIVFPLDSYQGLQAGSWLLYGLLFAAISLLLCWAAASAVNLGLIKKSILSGENGKADLQKFRLRASGILAAVMAVLFVIQLFLNSVLPEALMTGIRFDDWESFKTFMETPAEQDSYTAYSNGMIFGIDSTAVEEVASPAYSDEEPEVYIPASQIFDEDGTLLCEYTPKNGNVCQWSYDTDADSPNIRVYTFQDRQRANLIVDDIINPLYMFLYPIGAVLIYLIYRRKSKALK